MNTTRHSLLVGVMLTCIVTTLHAQDNPERTDPRAEMQRLQERVERAQELLADSFFVHPAVEGVAANYENTTKVTFVVVANKRVKHDDLGALIDKVDRLDPAGFKTLSGLDFRIDHTPMWTEPLKAFGVQIGGSTSNKAGCFQGTIGAAVVDRNNSGVQGFLTCNHVAAAEGPLLCPNAKKAKVVVPATAKTECHAEQVVGRLAKREQIKISDWNFVDAAFVETKEVRSDYCPVHQSGDFYSSVFLPPRLSVRKCGAGSNYTDNGVVLRLIFYGRVSFMPCGLAYKFSRQLIVHGRGFSQAGDSGAMAMDEYGKAVGMIFAGDESEWTLLNPAFEVLDLLKVKLVKP
jgi:hypothetical protein